MRTPDDARRDPQPGDVFRKGRTYRKCVRFDEGEPASAIAGKIRTVCRNGAKERMYIESFLRWAKDAEVLEVAND